MRTKFAERESERLDVATEMKTQTGTTRGFSWHVGTAKKHRARCLWVTTVAKGSPSIHSDTRRVKLEPVTLLRRSPAPGAP